MRWILFPPPVTQTFQPGDQVFIRTKSRKEIGRKGIVIKEEEVEKKEDESQKTQNELRVWVRIPSMQMNNNNSTAGQQSTNNENAVCKFFTTSFRPNRLVKIITDSMFDSTGCTVVPQQKDDNALERSTVVAITATTEKYRLLATSQIQSTDHILEIGCSNGECSLVIAKYLSKGSLVAFDTSHEMISQAREKMMSSQQNENVVQHTQFHVVDPFTEPRRALLLACGEGEMANSEKISVVLIDIGGNRDLESVLKMFAWIREKFSPRLCIIKSKQMVDEIMTMSALCRCEKKEEVSSSLSSSKDENITLPKRLKTGLMIHIQPSSGVITNGDDWFNTTCQERLILGGTATQKKTLLAPRFSHPKNAPLSLSPKDGKTPICRYYNYHKNGCIKSDCENDHVHCHWCLKPGHIALNCTNQQE